MRSAEAILNSKLTFGADTYDAGQRDNIIAAINEARREAILHAASVARITQEDKSNDWVGMYEEYFTVDQQSILDLLNHIK